MPSSPSCARRGVAAGSHSDETPHCRPWKALVGGQSGKRGHSVQETPKGKAGGVPLLAIHSTEPRVFSLQSSTGLVKAEHPRQAIL